MSFIQVEFIYFFAAVCAIYWIIPNRRFQNAFLLAASYVFYGWLSPKMTLLLFAVTASNYFAARALVRWPDWKDRILGMVVALSIVNLSVFKYFSWFASEIGPKLFSQEMSEQFATWHIVLPLGLSFYTFHNLAYTIDVYRGRFELRTDPIDYFLYGSYFPQLVAGPVERPQNVLPQLEQPRRFDRERLLSGFGLALWGAFKKVVLADAISPYVDLMFLAEHPSWAMVWSGALGFTIQALIDFSGYTDIARGTSRMLGIELMDNFAHPYLSATPMEFWQRWHISFSTWLRDYVYMSACFSDGVRRWVTIPFTGDWGPFANTSRALLITMLVSGLWHGSTMNFIVWGFYYFVIGTIYAAIVNNLPKKLKKQSQWRWLTVPIMFCLTVFGMHIFRQPSLSLFWEHLWLSPFEGTQAQWVVSTSMLGLCGFAALPLIAALIFERQLKKRLEGSFIFPALQTTTWAIWAVAIFISVRTTAADFIYFQF